MHNDSDDPGQRSPRSRRVSLNSISSAMRRPFLRGESEVIRRRHQQNGSPDIGHLTRLDEPIEFVTRDTHRYDIIATNTRGGRLIGPTDILKEGDTLRLGRTMHAGRVFILCSVVRVESARRGATLGRLVVAWERFTGDREDMVSLFLVGKLRVPMEGRFHPQGG